MSAPTSSDLVGQQALGDTAIPEVVVELAGASAIEFVWRNQAGGLTFRVGTTPNHRFVKWNPHGSGIDLERERIRLDWLAGRHPAPIVVGSGSDETAQWLVTEAVQGESTVGETWRARRPEAIQAIAEGLRAIHAIPIDDFPDEWKQNAWVSKSPDSLGPRPPVEHPMLVHGDACAPNTLISATGSWAGNVDFGDLAVGDRWADLAVAAMSLDWNFGDGHQHELFDAYGIEPDKERINYYRSLWHLDS